MALRFGPGAMVAAAFIGPGTVTTASAAGVATGGGLLWAVAFSILATIVLQELAVRSALVTNRDLSALIRNLSSGHVWRLPVLALVVLAIGVGNAAYQSGNLSGAGIGLSSALGLPHKAVIAAAAVLAGLLIIRGQYAWLERSLVWLVGLMGVLFCGLAAVLTPLFLQQPPDRLMPVFSGEHLTLMLALIGTTVVPYNLFLHASAARQRWRNIPLPTALTEARAEALISILIGGGITTAVVIVAAVLVPPDNGQPILEALVSGIEQHFPGYGRWLVGGGLFAAGLTSAIAAPVAAGWAVCGALGWSTEPNSASFKAVAVFVLLVGTYFALIATRPVALIISAQATNALLLPVIAGLLLWISSSTRVLGEFRSHTATRALAAIIVAVVTLLAAHKLLALLS